MCTLTCIIVLKIMLKKSEEFYFGFELFDDFDLIERLRRLLIGNCSYVKVDIFFSRALLSNCFNSFLINNNNRRIVMKDSDMISKEEHELNYLLKKWEKKQSIANRNKLIKKLDEFNADPNYRNSNREDFYRYVNFIDSLE